MAIVYAFVEYLSLLHSYSSPMLPVLTTGSGIIFPIRAKTLLPVERLVIQSVAVRGHLGNMTVWMSNANTNNNHNNGNGGTQENGETSFCLSKRHWTMVYSAFHKPSPPRTRGGDAQRYTTLDFKDTPVLLEPGQVRLLYIHSSAQTDEALVYDNSDPRRRSAIAVRYEDDKIAIYSGKAHLSPTVFGQTPIWGWGNAWRDRREFVGQVNYGTLYKLWSPDRHDVFGNQFQCATKAMLMAQRREECPISRLPDECIYYILNMCRWDWFDDTSRNLLLRRRGRRRSALLLQQEERTPLAELNTPTSQQETCQETEIHSLNENLTNHVDGTIMQAGAETVTNDMEDDDEDFVIQDEMDEDDDDELVDDDEDDDDSEDGSDAWDENNAYATGSDRFVVPNLASDDENSDEESDLDAEETEHDRSHGHQHVWFGRNVVRRLVVRALAGDGNG